MHAQYMYTFNKTNTRVQTIHKYAVFVYPICMKKNLKTSYMNIHIYLIYIIFNFPFFV